MKRAPRNVKIAFNHAGLTRFGGIYFLTEFVRVLQLRRFLARHLDYPRRNEDYTLSQAILALMYPVVLGLNRLETAALLRWNGTFQYLTGLPSYPDPQTLRRFLLHAPVDFRRQLHRVNDRLLQRFIHWPEHRSRLILDLDSTVLTVFGHQEGARKGFNRRYRGKRSYDPLVCLEANSAFLWDIELRTGDAGTWSSSPELLGSWLDSIPADIREVRVRADSGFGYEPVLAMLEARPYEYAVVARFTAALKSQLTRLHYQPANAVWEIAEIEHRPKGWPQARRCIVARRWVEQNEPDPSCFTLGRFLYRAWISNLQLSPVGVWHFYDGRAGVEPRICQLREDFALRRIPTRNYPANALYLEVIRLAYNLVTAFERTCLPKVWQNLTLGQLRYQLFWLPAQLIRPGNRPTLRMASSPALEEQSDHILCQLQKVQPLEG